MNATPKRYPPDDPREWLNRGQSSLVLAEHMTEDVYLEDLGFNAQQAGEKAVKALLIHREIEYPFEIPGDVVAVAAEPVSAVNDAS